jgi:hypothetical protein
MRKASARISFFTFCVIGLGLVAAGCQRDEAESVPVAWKKLVRTEGQHYPIPTAWLETPEGRIAHELKLPASVPAPVPFDFSAAGESKFWVDKDDIANAYFRHLCKTEAGFWRFRDVGPVEGLYFARPMGPKKLTEEYLQDPFGPEAPAMERLFQLIAEDMDEQGGHFVRPPFRNYRFVEQPRRDVGWQKATDMPYIRIFGYTQAVFIKPGQVVAAMNELTPMEFIGIAEPTARYAITWRGITRPKDRRYRVAGVELIAYERSTREIIALRRTFAIAPRSRGGKSTVFWFIARPCSQADEVNLRPLAYVDFIKKSLPEPAEKSKAENGMDNRIMSGNKL